MRKLLRETPHKIRDYGEAILREEKKISLEGSSKDKVIFAIGVITVWLVFNISSCPQKASVTITPYIGATKGNKIVVDIGSDYKFTTYEKTQSDSECAVTVYFDKKREEK